MENFIYYTPTKIFFGRHQEEKIASIIRSYGFKRILFHYGQSSLKKMGLYDKIVENLTKEGICFFELGGVEPNPKLSLVEEGIKLVKQENIDFILAVGGGSVIDSAKAIAVGAKVDFSPWKFSIKEEIPTDHIPVGVVLTLAASGSDMSDSCVITNDRTLEKRGFNSEQNRPLFAVLNPELTYSVSPYQTACGIVDILMHTLERYFSKGEETPLTDAIALGLMKTVLDAGKTAYDHPKDYNARATLMWANSLSHNGLTSCGRNFVMSVHQIEHEISGMYDHISHGAGLAVLWPAWAKLAYPAAKMRFLRFAYEVMNVEKSDQEDQDILEGIRRLKAYFKAIGMPTSMKELEIPEEKFREIAANYSFKGQRILQDIIPVDEEKALEILYQTNQE